MNIAFRLAGAAALFSVVAPPEAYAVRGSTGLQEFADHRSGTSGAVQLIPFSASRLHAGDRTSFLQRAHGFTFEGGVAIRSNRRALYDLERFFGDYWAGILRDGRWLFLQRSEGDPDTIDRIRIAATRELAGLPELEIREQAAVQPRIHGYDYVTSFPVSGTSREYLGLWRDRSGRTPRSLVILFEEPGGNDSPPRCVILARSALDLSLVWVSPSLHGELWEVVLVSRASPGRPIHVLRYAWTPGAVRHGEASDCVRNRGRATSEQSGTDRGDAAPR